MSQFVPVEWVVIDALVCAELADPVSFFLHERCSHGVNMEDESELVRISAYFSPDEADEARKALLDYIEKLGESFPEFPKPTVTFRTTLSENWAVAWKDNFKVLEVGSTILITPPWLNPEPHDRHMIIIEPAEAFGTGSHETTRGCLELLEDVLGDYGGRSATASVLDVGCGSGILAIAAVKLGASPVTAIDNDPVAIESARENSSLNGVLDKICLECKAIENVEVCFDIVIANLDYTTLSRNVSILPRLFRDRLIISGITVDQWESVKKLFGAESLKPLKELQKSEWVSAIFSH